jgi:hypothetical protein
MSKAIIRRRSRKKVSKKKTFRSGLEDTTALHISSKGVNVLYETSKIKYTIPESDHVYTPDFILPNGIIVETKGRFMIEDRKKHLLIRAQHPDKDIRFVFTRSATKLYKGAKTTYSDWCVKYNFKFADKKIPDSWFNEQQKEKTT